MEGVREINVAQIKDMILKGDGCKVVLTVGEHLRTSSEKFFFLEKVGASMLPDTLRAPCVSIDAPK